MKIKTISTDGSCFKTIGIRHDDKVNEFLSENNIHVTSIFTSHHSPYSKYIVTTIHYVDK
jgi:hypothetical protein